MRHDLATFLPKLAACGALASTLALALHGRAAPGTIEGATSAVVSQPSVVSSTLATFPQTKGWFAIVRDARFDTNRAGALVPRFAELSHPRVRSRDGAGYALTVALPGTFGAALRVGNSSDPSRRWVELVPLAASNVRAVVDQGLVVYASAYPDTDVLYKSTPTHVDEYLVLHRVTAPSTWSYRVALGAGIARVRQAGSFVEAVDAKGRPWLRLSRPVAVDRVGMKRTGTIRVDGSRLVVAIDLAGLSFPVLVDPDWKSTGDMAYGRFFHHVNQLPDGRVVASGGCSAAVCSGDLRIGPCRTVVANIEALDMQTRVFSMLDASSEPRYFHVAESLPTGDVLIAGGCTTSNCDVTATADILDGSTGKISTTSALPEAGAGQASLVLPNGRVLVAGGCTTAGCSKKVFAFDEATKEWATLASMQAARGRAAISLTTDGRVLVTGGCTTIECAGVLASAELYTPKTDTWLAIDPMSVPRAGHYQAALPGGRVLVGGGCAEQACATVHKSAEVFDPSTLDFAATEDGEQPRFGAVATMLPNGAALISQGCTASNACDLTNEVYDPKADGFTMIEPAVTSRAFHALIVQSDNLVIANGGCQPGTCSWWNEYYDLKLVDGGVVPFDAGAGAGGTGAGGGGGTGSGSHGTGSGTNGTGSGGDGTGTGSGVRLDGGVALDGGVGGGRGKTGARGNRGGDGAHLDGGGRSAMDGGAAAADRSGGCDCAVTRPGAQSRLPALWAVAAMFAFVLRRKDKGGAR